MAGGGARLGAGDLKSLKEGGRSANLVVAHTTKFAEWGEIERLTPRGKLS